MPSAARLALAIDTPKGAANTAAAPVITSVPTALTHGATYSAYGLRFSGVSQSNAYGDDAQAATNYPLVAIINDASAHVFFARTHAFSSMAVASPAVVRTALDLSATIERGPSKLIVIANGIQSKPVAVTQNSGKRYVVRFANQAECGPLRARERVASGRAASSSGMSRLRAISSGDANGVSRDARRSKTGFVQEPPTSHASRLLAAGVKPGRPADDLTIQINREMLVFPLAGKFNFVKDYSNGQVFRIPTRSE